MRNCQMDFADGILIINNAKTRTYITHFGVVAKRRTAVSAQIRLEWKKLRRSGSASSSHIYASNLLPHRLEVVVRSHAHTALSHSMLRYANKAIFEWQLLFAWHDTAQQSRAAPNRAERTQRCHCYLIIPVLAIFSIFRFLCAYCCASAKCFFVFALPSHLCSCEFGAKSHAGLRHSSSGPTTNERQRKNYWMRAYFVCVGSRESSNLRSGPLGAGSAKSNAQCKKATIENI